MKRYYFLLLLFCNINVFAANFIIENYTGKDITVEVVTDKTWGSKTQLIAIPYGERRTVDTGMYGVVSDGIRWDDGNRYLERFSIKPFSTGLIMRLFADTYEYMYTSPMDYIKRGGTYPSGYGKIATLVQ